MSNLYLEEDDNDSGDGFIEGPESLNDPNRMPAEFTESEAIGRNEGIPQDLSGNIARGMGTQAWMRAVKLANELAERGLEALKLYQPSPKQKEFHACRVKECIFVAGNQIGKSLSGFIEDARAALNMDPHKKYPATDGKIAVLGFKDSHIALNVYRYLLQPGAFRIIKDLETDQWRTFHPWVPSDAVRLKESQLAPPIIPHRFIRQIHWKSKAGCIFKRIDLTTGWQIHTFSSTSRPDGGFQLDLAHIDEDIQNEQWYPELIARLSIRNGRLIWTALPYNENDALTRVVERAEEEMAEHALGGEEPSTVKVHATVFDNPYMTDEARNENIKRWKAIGEDEYRKRALGELITDTVRMYPTFSKDSHSVDRYSELFPEILGEYVRTRQIPVEWCLRYYVDPGFDNAAGLLIATVPGDMELHIAVGEVYRHQNTPDAFAEATQKIVGDRVLQSMVMDAHGGALTSLADGRRPQEVYEKWFLDKGIVSAETKHRFRAGCDDVAFRETKLRERLAIVDNGIPQFLYDPQACPNLEMEMIRFRKIKIKGETTDKGNRRSKTHAIDCWEYCAADTLHYIKPPVRRRLETRGERRVKAYLERKARKKRQSFGSSSAYSGGIVF